MRFAEVVPGPLAGQRLDRVVSMVAGCSRSTAATWITDGLVTVNGAVAAVRSVRLVVDDAVVIDAPDAVETVLAADPTVEVAVVYADDDVLVVDKPAGLVVHPGAGHVDGTLVQGLLARFPELAGVGDADRPGIVHRLDRGTSGLLMVARTQVAYTALVAALSARSVDRRYDVLVHGHPESDQGIVDAPIGRSSRDPTRMAVSSTGRHARTHYEVIARFDDPAAYTWLSCHLETGRTHQIRVHLAAIGLPVVADTRYGGNKRLLPLDRPFLHAAHLGFDHPVSGKKLTFDASLPRRLQEVIDRLTNGIATADVDAPA